MIECDPSETMAEIKQKIQDKEGIPPDQQTLVFARKHISSQETRTLAELQIMNESTIHFVLMLRDTSGRSGGFGVASKPGS